MGRLLFSLIFRSLFIEFFQLYLLCSGFAGAGFSGATGLDIFVLILF